MISCLYIPFHNIIVFIIYFLYLNQLITTLKNAKRDMGFIIDTVAYVEEHRVVPRTSVRTSQIWFSWIRLVSKKKIWLFCVRFPYTTESEIALEAAFPNLIKSTAGPCMYMFLYFLWRTRKTIMKNQLFMGTLGLKKVHYNWRSLVHYISSTSNGGVWQSEEICLL